LKILITGAGGFLGSYLSKHLHYEIVALTRQELDLSDAEATNKYFKSNRFDAVIHCGASGRNTPAIEDWNIVNNNLSSIMNLVLNHNRFSKLINIGSGAEFDISKPINCVNESEIFEIMPEQSYGKSKNLVSRYLHDHPNCYNLRLFGCFDSSEDDARLLKKMHSVISQGNTFSILDREFDMISAIDFVTIVDAVLNNTITEHDINCVYPKKYRLSEILSVYCNKHGLDPSLIKVTGQGLNYTGNGNTLSKYHLNLLGLEQSLANYEIKSK
jgi:GDP-L-fucose synthase